MMKMQTMSLMKTDAFGRRKRCSPKCLFGVPDPLEIEKAYGEAITESADHFLKKWNLNVFTSQPGKQPGGLEWVDVRSELLEDRLSAEVVSVPSPGGRLPDTNAEVATCSPTPVGSRRLEPVRYSPYRKQQKLTDYWRTAKAPSLPQATPNKRQSMKSEDSHTITQRESPNIAI